MDVVGGDGFPAFHAATIPSRATRGAPAPSSYGTTVPVPVPVAVPLAVLERPRVSPEARQRGHTPGAMQILLTRLSADRHRLVVERDDGSRIEAELETRSVLLHDLVHFAVEREAGLAGGFWGSVAAGADFDELAEAATDAASGELWLAESLVGPLQSVWHGRLGVDEYVARVGPIAPFVDREFVERVLERLRKLWGQWRGTPFHETLRLEWD